MWRPGVIRPVECAHATILVKSESRSETYARAIGGDGNGVKIFNAILKPLLEKAGIPYRFIQTTHQGHPKQISMSVLEEFATAIKQNNLEYFVEILDIPLTNTFDAGGISTAQRYIKDWISKSSTEIIIPMQHFKLVYDVLTDNRKALAIRDFTKAMSRLNVQTTRKRIGSGKNSSAPRGVLITWVLDKKVKDNLIEEHFDNNDTTLLGENTMIN